MRQLEPVSKQGILQLLAAVTGGASAKGAPTSTAQKVLDRESRVAAARADSARERAENRRHFRATKRRVNNILSNAGQYDGHYNRVLYRHHFTLETLHGD